VIDDWDETGVSNHNQDEQQQQQDTQETSQVVEETKSSSSSSKQQEPEEEELDEVEEEKLLEEVTFHDPRPHLNMVFIGHVDAGKSTMSGNMLYLTGHVDARTIEKYEREAKERGRDSWWLAFVMDTNEEERSKGKTVEVGRAKFATDTRRYTILDAPGHRSYVPNMIQGASQADVAILVISARRGEFETGFERGGQTREHALLAKTLGVRSLIVVVNKMDDHTVNWSQERFDECVSKIKPYLKSVGFKVKKQVKFIPVSAITGANLVNPVDDVACPWWSRYLSTDENNTTTPTLLEALDQVPLIETGDVTASSLTSFAMPILDAFADRGNVHVLGKIEQGVLRTGMHLCINPYTADQLRSRVEEVVIEEGDPVDFAATGENVIVRLSGNVNVEEVYKGCVLSHRNSPIAPVTTFIAQILVVDLPENRPILSAGYSGIFNAHTVEEEIEVVNIGHLVERKHGEVTKRRVKFARNGQTVTVKLQTARPVVLDVFENRNFLGRFTIRDEGRTIAIGIVTRLLD
jgi:peptide chain release factor subunit 3